MDTLHLGLMWGALPRVSRPSRSVQRYAECGYTGRPGVQPLGNLDGDTSELQYSGRPGVQSLVNLDEDTSELDYTGLSQFLFRGFHLYFVFDRAVSTTYLVAT